MRLPIRFSEHNTYRQSLNYGTFELWQKLSLSEEEECYEEIVDNQNMYNEDNEHKGLFKPSRATTIQMQFINTHKL